MRVQNDFAFIAEFCPKQVVEVKFCEGTFRPSVCSQNPFACRTYRQLGHMASAEGNTPAANPSKSPSPAGAFLLFGI